MSTSSPRTAFISGHTDLCQADFNRYYIPQLNKALAAGDEFLLGDATGVDEQAVTYLLSPDVIWKYPDIKQRITVYASRTSNVSKLRQRHGIQIVPPNDPSLAPTPEATAIVGFENRGKDRTRFKYTVHDAHLTLLSDYDILYARTEAESKEFYGNKWRPRLSATEANRRRRLILVARREGREDPRFEEKSVWDDGTYKGFDEDESLEVFGELPRV